jgi:uncharacterized protein with PIN domain
MTVLDASALLAYLRDEADADVFERALAENAVIGPGRRRRERAVSPVNARRLASPGPDVDVEVIR